MALQKRAQALESEKKEAYDGKEIDKLGDEELHNVLADLGLSESYDRSGETPGSDNLKPANTPSVTHSWLFLHYHAPLLFSVKAEHHQVHSIHARQSVLLAYLVHLDYFQIQPHDAITFLMNTHSNVIHTHFLLCKHCHIFL